MKRALMVLIMLGVFSVWSISTENMTVDGYLGVGTTTPQGPLDIHGGYGNMYVNTGGHELVFTRDSYNYIGATDPTGKLCFRTGPTSNSNSRMMIDSSGNIFVGDGAGTNAYPYNPLAKFDIDGVLRIRGVNTTTSPDLYNNGGTYTTSTAIYTSKNDSGLYMKSDGPIFLKSGGDTVRLAVLKNGYVGINKNNPIRELDVNGKIRLVNLLTSTTTAASGGTEIYACKGANNDPEFWIIDSTGDYTRLNSHASPEKIDPTAQSSFVNSTIALPFSFTHKNAYIGKGQTVDMAKLVSWAEKKMQIELGEKGGQLVYTYDMPQSETFKIEDFYNAHADDQARQMLDKLEKMPLIKINLGPDGRIPDEAIEQVPEYAIVMEKANKEEKKLDLESKRVVAVTNEVEMPVKKATGRQINQLKSNWVFLNGDLYRKPTLQDINLDEFVKEYPSFPDWMINRIRDGSKINMDLITFKEQVRIELNKMLAEKGQ